MAVTRVLHVADKFGVAGSTISGVARLFCWWMPRFDPARWRVSLLKLRGPEGSDDEIRAAGVDLRVMDRGKFDLRTARDLERTVREEGFGLLHLHGYGSSNFGRWVSKRTGVPCIVHEHFVDPAMPLYQVPVDAAQRNVAKRGIAVSRSVKDFMVGKRRMPEDRVEVVVNGAPIAQFAAGERDGDRLGVPPGRAIVGTIGRLDEQKGNRYLVAAAPEIVKRRPEAHFMIVGDGPYLESLRAQARDLGLADRFTFPGYRTDVPHVLSVFDVQVLPSLWEGIPLTLFEGMAAGKTIVSTNVDGLGEVLEDGRNALVVPPRDPQALARAVVRVLDDAALAARLAARAKDESAQYDIAATVRRIEEIYEEVLGS